MNIEENVSQTINQEGATVGVTISPRSWLRWFWVKRINLKVYSPTPETMARISAIISHLSYEMPEDENQLMPSILSSTDLPHIAKIAGILTGGIGIRGRLLGVLIRKHTDLASVQRIIFAYASLIDVQGFFGVITSLRGTSILRPTKEVSETHPSGPSSEAPANTTGGKKRVCVRK